MRTACAAILVIAAILLGGGGRASGATLAALPATVRVNVAGLGVSYAVIASTGTITATGPDGQVLYAGGGRTLARTNVRRIETAGLELPPRGTRALSPDERAERAVALHESRAAIAEAGPRAIVTVPFQFALLQSAADDLGRPVIEAARIAAVRFTTSDGLLTLNGRAFRGSFELAPDDEGDLIVVNTVSPHDYLASVVGSEEPSSWENEALASQAVAARTYLYTHLGKHQHYDLEGDTRDQQYDGTEKEDARTLRAVERTAGLIVTYRGGPIEALYSANAGGVTEDSENVFGNALPYLRSVPSPGDAAAVESGWGRESYEWTKEMSADQLRDLLQRRGLDVGTPTAIQLTQTSPTGHELSARVIGTAGTKDIGKDRARYYFGLLSSLFTVVATPTGADERVTVADLDRIDALDRLGAHVKTTSFVPVLDANGNELGLRATGYVYELPARFVFTGRGFGHRVGMSQWGAQGMALKGAAYPDILTHYYQGTALTNVGGG